MNRIKWEQDGTLTFRRSCAHGVCGSNAMRVNGYNRLACKLLMADVGQRVTIEVMLGYPVIRDLAVDMDLFFAKYEKVKPYLINDEPEPRTERLQSPGERACHGRRRQAHPLRRLHRLMPASLGQSALSRHGLQRERSPLHL